MYDIDNYISYPVAVEFLSGKRNDYTINGMDLEVQSIPSLYPHPVEIVKKCVKPSINWDHVSSKFNYLAEDDGGAAFLYEGKPSPHDETWALFRSSGEIVEAHMFASYTQGTCNWKDSLISRPKDV